MVAGPERELLADVADLGPLRLLERHPGPLPVRARVRHRRIEHQLEEVVAEVVVGVDVVLRRRERLARPAVRAQLLQPVEPLQGRVRPLRLEVAAEEREEADEIVAVPVTVDV